jgi:hypothetical protein
MSYDMDRRDGGATGVLPDVFCNDVGAIEKTSAEGVVVD